MTPRTLFRGTRPSARSQCVCCRRATRLRGSHLPWRPSRAFLESKRAYIDTTAAPVSMMRNASPPTCSWLCLDFVCWRHSMITNPSPPTLTPFASIFHSVEPWMCCLPSTRSSPNSEQSDQGGRRLFLHSSPTPCPLQPSNPHHLFQNLGRREVSDVISVMRQIKEVCGYAAMRLCGERVNCHSPWRTGG